MKKLLLPTLCFCAALCLSACSVSEETEEEHRGRIEQFTDEVARDATDAIQRPLDKARTVRDLSQQRVRDLEQQD